MGSWDENRTPYYKALHSAQGKLRTGRWNLAGMAENDFSSDTSDARFCYLGPFCGQLRLAVEGIQLL